MTADFAIQLIQAHHPHLSEAAIRARLDYATSVNLERRYMYVEVPKAACTSFKTLLRRLEGLPPIDPFQGRYPEVTRAMAVHDRRLFGMPALTSFDSASQERILCAPDFLRFAIVRNPYTRLVSTWRDKVRLCAPGYEPFQARLRGGVPGRFTPANLISFAEFLGVIEGENLTLCNPHWRRQVDLLFFPALNLNLVAQLEHIDEALARFLAHAGFPQDQAVPEINRTSGDGDAYDQALADRVHALYAADFAAFGYARESWSPAREPEAIPDARHAAELAERHVMLGQLYRRRDALRRRLAEQARPAGREALAPLGQADFDLLFERVVDPIDGSLRREEARLLWELAASAEGSAIVEIGSHRGRRTAALALGALRGAGAPIYAVDAHEPSGEQNGGPIDRGHFMAAMLRHGLFHLVHLLNLESAVVAPGWRQPVALLILGGDHRKAAASRDFALWRDKLAPGAVVALQGGSEPALTTLAPRFVKTAEAGRITEFRATRQ
jgi:Sulfotransferase family/Methyltransferase domain